MTGVQTCALPIWVKKLTPLQLQQETIKKAYDNATLEDMQKLAANDVSFAKDALTSIDKATQAINGELSKTNKGDFSSLTPYLQKGLLDKYKASPTTFDKYIEQVTGSTKTEGIENTMAIARGLMNWRGISEEDLTQSAANREGHFADPIQNGINKDANILKGDIAKLRSSGAEEAYNRYADLANRASSIGQTLKTLQDQVQKGQLPQQDQQQVQQIQGQMKKLQHQLAPYVQQYKKIVQQVDAKIGRAHV